MKHNLRIIEKVLDNGLHVTLIQKPNYHKSLFMCAAPVGGFDVKQELDGQCIVHPAGCAHYLEHQMFRLNGKDVMETFAHLQSQANAFTSYQETCYYFQTTGDIEKPLSLLLEFVETLDIDDASVDKEKGIIVNEYDMDQQSPEQRLLKETYRSMYHSHPIRQEILGTRDDIKNMTVEQLTRFYRLNYDPSRLHLVGVTGHELEPILSFVEKHQEQFPAKISQKPGLFIEAEPEKVCRTSYEDHMDISIPFVCIGYKMKPCKSIKESLRQDLAVQVRLDSLFSSMNPDYQSWLDKRIITQLAGAECDFTCDRGYVLFYAQTKKVEEFIGLVENIVDRIQKEAMNENLFKTIQASYIGQGIRGLDNFENLAIETVHSDFAGYDYIESLDYIKQITKEEVDHICFDLSFENRTVTKMYPNE